MMWVNPAPQEAKDLRSGQVIFDSLAETLSHMISPFGMGCVVIPIAIRGEAGDGLVSEKVEDGCHVEAVSAKCSLISADGVAIDESKQRLAYASLLRKVADIWTREK